MKLWQVTIERSILVVAETESEAEQLGTDHESDERYNDPDYVSVHEVTDIKRVPKDWRDGIPYGESGDQTCKQFLDSLTVATDFNNDMQGKLI